MQYGKKHVSEIEHKKISKISNQKNTNVRDSNV